GAGAAAGGRGPVRDRAPLGPHVSEDAADRAAWRDAAGDLVCRHCALGLARQGDQPAAVQADRWLPRRGAGLRQWGLLPRVRAVEQYEPWWIEEPLKPDDVAGHAEIARVLDIPVATGEIHATRWDFRERISSQNAACA